MADQDKQSTSSRHISDEERFRYIGFDVFPGKPKDLFKSESEKAQLVDEVVRKRSRGDLIREQCTLLIERVSSAERLVLVIASAAILLSLILPWYTAYKETVVQPTATTTQQATTTSDQSGRKEEVLSGVRVAKKVQRSYNSLSGIGSLLAIGSVGSYLFSGGPILMLTALVMLLFTLSAIALPIYMLVTLFKQKQIDDQFALRLKRQLRLNWIPVGLFFFALILSFVGSDYGSGATSIFTSIGSSYGPGAFLSTLSYGILITLAGFIVMAAKGIEI